MKSRKIERLIYWTVIFLAGLLFPLQFAEKAQAAISYVGSASTPADNGSQAGPTVAVTPPSMQAGDFVLIIGAYWGTSPTISETGGQTWTTLTSASNTLKTRLFYCIFNGTWSANPSITVGSGTYAMTAIMHVFRGVDQSNPFDVAQTTGTYSAPSSPYDVTITGITTNTDGAWVLAVWGAIEYTTETWSLQTSGWVTLGGNQYRNNASSCRHSISAAYKVISSHGASGNVTNRMDHTDGYGTTHILALKPDSSIGVTKRWGDGTCGGTCDYTGVSDNYMDQSSSQENHGISTNLWVGNESTGDQRTRTMINFNLSNLGDLISSSSQIVSAKLKLKSQCYFSCGSPQSMDIDVFRIKKSWIEGTQDGAPAAGEPAWRYQANPTQWTAWGCDDSTDRDTTPDDTVTVSEEGVWYEWDVTNSLKYMFDHNEYYGWLLKWQLEDSAKRYRFWSSEYTTSADRPYLEITYADNQVIERWGEGTCGGTCDHGDVTEDVYLDQVRNNWNLGGETELRVGDETGSRADRTMIKFNLSDLSTRIENSSQIVSARLKVRTINAQAGGTINVDAFRVKKPWTEGTHTYGQQTASAGDVTYTYQSYDTDSWTGAGCDNSADRETTADDTVTVSATETWYSWNVTDSVKYMVDHPTEYYGWILKSQSEGDADCWRFYSKENTAQSNAYRPYLEITLNGASTGPNTFEYRRAITIDKTKVDSSCAEGYPQNFPVLISLSNQTWLKTTANGGNIYNVVQDAGGFDIPCDLIFRASDGKTQLPHEIEKYDGTTNGDLVAWVQVPALSKNNNTTIYVYYGNSAITTDESNPTGVWDSNFVGVWHLKENPAGSAPQIKNSKSASYHGTSYGSMTSEDQVSDNIDGSLVFDGIENETTGDRIQIGSIVGDSTSFTVSLWFKTSATGGPYKIWAEGNTGNNNPLTYLSVNEGYTGRVEFGIRGTTGSSGSVGHPASSAGSWNNGGWHHVVGVQTSKTARELFIDGTSRGTSSANPGAVSLNTGNIGAINRMAIHHFYPGGVDEVRISSSVRDACWIGTEYSNQYAPSTFYSVQQTPDNPAPTGIELSSFKALGDGGAVNVQWETKTEIDNLGFNLYRSTERDGTYTKLNSSLIPGLLSSAKGKRYSFTDAIVTKGKLYYYKLEDMDLKGKSTVHGPVCVDWDRDGIPDDVDPEVRISDSATGGGSGGGGSSGGGDISDGDLWVYGDSTVTRVSLKGFRAQGTGDGVLVEWQTGYEVDNLGFHLYREVDGELVRLTPELVAGSALLAGSGISLRAGHQYQWLDVSAIADDEREQSSLEERHAKGVTRGSAQGALRQQNNSAFASSETLLERSAPRAKRSALYWLEDVDLNGKRTMHGPVEVQLPAPGSPLQASEGRRAELMSEFGKRLDKQYEEFWKIQDLREKLKRNDRGASRQGRDSRTGLSGLEDRPSALRQQNNNAFASSEALLERSAPQAQRSSSAAVLGPGANVSVSSVDEHNQTPAGRIISTPLSDKPPKVLPAVQQTLAGGPALKLLVKEEGWYRVSSSELKAAGLSSWVDPQFLRLYTEGVEVPLGVISEKQGKSVSLEAIEFYGVGLDTPSTDTRVYWLVEGMQPGKRVGLSHGQGGQTGASSFAYTVEKKDRVFYFASLKNGEESNFFGPVVNQAGADQLLEVRNLDLSASGDATLEVRIQGVTALPHQVNVLVNESAIGTLSWEGQALKTGVFSVPQSYLLEGENLVTLVAVGGETDVSLLDSIRLAYGHTYRAYEDELKCQAQGGTQVSIDGFRTPGVRVFDITDAGDVFEVETKGKAVDSGYGVTFRVPGSGARTLLALTDQRVKSLAGIRANQPSLWRKAGGYDLVIVSHGDFMGSLSSLEALRRSQGLSVGVVDIEDVYDEFSYGMKSPQALKNFLSHAKSSWSRPPRFVLLVGDASFDPRNYLGYGDQDYVPTKLIDTVHLETASDDWFVDFDNDGLPDMAIGRLPVQTAEEAATVVSKLIGYEKSGEKKEAILVADRADNPNDFDFEGSSEGVRALLPASILVRKIFRGQFSTDAQARAELLGGISQGPVLVNYMGHGSLGVWRGDLLTVNDAESLINGLQLPLFVNMTCLNGFFQAPYADSMAEGLLKAQGGGAIAIWASSGMTEPDKQALMNKEMIRVLFNGQGLTFGEAMKRAKAATSDLDVRRTWVLFGDPTTRLKP
jgi:hypothetical protein